MGTGRSGYCVYMGVVRTVRTVMVLRDGSGEGEEDAEFSSLWTDGHWPRSIRIPDSGSS